MASESTLIGIPFGIVVARVQVPIHSFQWARERSGIPFEKLADKFPQLPSWETGEILPTMRQLEDFATTTMAPLGYFFLPEPPVEQLPIPDFRTVTDQPVKKPSPNLLDTVYAMQRRQEWLRDERKEKGAEPLAFIGSATPQSPVLALANTIRERMGLAVLWAKEFATWTDALGTLRERVEALEVVIVVNGVVGNNNHRKLDPDEFRGFVLIDQYAPLIFVNGSDAKAAQMFTIAHELAHLWVGQSAVFNLERLLPANVEVELFCNRVAAEFLVPAAALVPLWEELKGSQTRFVLLARHFKVSEIVAARRLLDQQLISANEFFSFYGEYIARERIKPKASGGDFYLTQNNRVGRVFGRAVVQAVREGRLLHRDAYALTGLRGVTFDNFGQKIG